MERVMVAFIGALVWRMLMTQTSIFICSGERTLQIPLFLLGLEVATLIKFVLEIVMILIQKVIFYVHCYCVGLQSRHWMSLFFKVATTAAVRICGKVSKLAAVAAVIHKEKSTMAPKVIKIGTHSGAFHADEVLACSMLRLLPQYKDADIVRSRDPSTLDVSQSCLSPLALIEINIEDRINLIVTKKHTNWHLKWLQTEFCSSNLGLRHRRGRRRYL